jgi:hypothetical protein
VNANTIVAVCAVVIAAAALVVSVSEARATRKHNRYSVVPKLKLTTTFPVGKKAGLILSNSGLGPADVKASSLALDGEELGAFDERTVNKVRDRLSVRPSAFTLGGQNFLKTDFDRFLLSVEPYDREQHQEFYELIRHRLRVEIWYDSLYGGEQFKAVHQPKDAPEVRRPPGIGPPGVSRERTGSEPATPSGPSGSRATSRARSWP